jgi:glycosyltransferase involved in cell wall biosynthesis
MSNQFNNQPLVSVIMNCYNGEAYLYESIKSVLFQTYANWELIFWDNRSDDKSAEIFKSYNDKRFKYYYAPQHTLLYEARNEAIKKSSGEFIAFLDTDDFWEKDKLELQIPLFKDLDVGVVYGNLYVVNEKLNRKKIFLKGKKPRGFILDDLLKNYCTGLVTLVIRKSFLDNYQPVFDNSFHIMGDFDLMIRMSTKYKFDCVEKPIASWRVHGKNESLLYKTKQIKELKIWYEKMISHPIVFNNKNFLNINNMINNLEVINLILENDLKKARLQIKKIPFSLKKIKYLIALLLPNNFVKKFIQF